MIRYQSTLFDFEIFPENIMKSKENFLQDNPPASKSQRRREALELKSLGAILLDLPPARLASIPMADDLRAAVIEARGIRSHVARKRQLQYVAKLLRRSDPEPIVQALEQIENEARQLNARQHRSEAWRDCLLQAGDTALAELMRDRPQTDAQAIRQLVRNARSEAARDKAPTAARALFRLLRDLDEAETLPPPPKS
jgi:ribosome-associated protein